MSIKIACKKCICPYNHRLAAVKTSFFCPKNVGFLNSKLEWVTDVNQTTDCGLRLSKIRMQDVEKILIKTDKLLSYTLINFDEQRLII